MFEHLLTIEEPNHEPITFIPFFILLDGEVLWSRKWGIKNIELEELNEA